MNLVLPTDLKAFMESMVGDSASMLAERSMKEKNHDRIVKMFVEELPLYNGIEAGNLF